MTLLAILALLLLIVGVLTLAAGVLGRDTYRTVLGVVLVVLALWVHNGAA